MDAIETKCLNIFEKIKWHEVGNGKDYDQYLALLYEFFRRTTNFAEEYKVNSEFPWVIITKIL